MHIGLGELLGTRTLEPGVSGRKVGIPCPGGFRGQCCPRVESLQGVATVQSSGHTLPSQPCNCGSLHHPWGGVGRLNLLRGWSFMEKVECLQVTEKCWMF